MRRLNQAQAEIIEHAFEVIGPRLSGRLRHVDFLCGVDPVWVGLHGYTRTDDGRAYKDTAHCAYPVHTNDRSMTIVLPMLETVSVVVHELGHALHATYAPGHIAFPTTAYAKKNVDEAFAEHFTSRYFWYGDQDVWWSDEATRALIDSLDL